MAAGGGGYNILYIQIRRWAALDSFVSSPPQQTPVPLLQQDFSKVQAGPRGLPRFGSFYSILSGLKIA